LVSFYQNCLKNISIKKQGITGLMTVILKISNVCACITHAIPTYTTWGQLPIAPDQARTAQCSCLLSSLVTAVALTMPPLGTNSMTGRTSLDRMCEPTIPTKARNAISARELVPGTRVPRTLVPGTLVLRTRVHRTLVPGTLVLRTRVHRPLVHRTRVHRTLIMLGCSLAILEGTVTGRTPLELARALTVCTCLHRLLWLLCLQTILIFNHIRPRLAVTCCHDGCERCSVCCVFSVFNAQSQHSRNNILKYCK